MKEDKKYMNEGSSSSIVCEEQGGMQRVGCQTNIDNNGGIVFVDEEWAKDPEVERIWCSLLNNSTNIEKPPSPRHPRAHAVDLQLSVVQYRRKAGKATNLRSRESQSQGRTTVLGIYGGTTGEQREETPNINNQYPDPMGARDSSSMWKKQMERYKQQSTNQNRLCKGLNLPSTTNSQGRPRRSLSRNLNNTNEGGSSISTNMYKGDVITHLNPTPAKTLREKTRPLLLQYKDNNTMITHNIPTNISSNINTNPSPPPANITIPTDDTSITNSSKVEIYCEGQPSKQAQPPKLAGIQRIKNIMKLNASRRAKSSMNGVTNYSRNKVGNKPVHRAGTIVHNSPGRNAKLGAQSSTYRDPTQSSTYRDPQINLLREELDTDEKSNSIESREEKGETPKTPKTPKTAKTLEPIMMNMNANQEFSSSITNLLPWMTPKTQERLIKKDEDMSTIANISNIPNIYEREINIHITPPSKQNPSCEYQVPKYRDRENRLCHSVILDYPKTKEGNYTSRDEIRTLDLPLRHRNIRKSTPAHIRYNVRIPGVPSSTPKRLKSLDYKDEKKIVYSKRIIDMGTRVRRSNSCIRSSIPLKQLTVVNSRLKTSLNTHITNSISDLRLHNNYSRLGIKRISTSTVLKNFKLNSSNSYITKDSLLHPFVARVDQNIKVYLYIYI